MFSFTTTTTFTSPGVNNTVSFNISSTANLGVATSASALLHVLGKLYLVESIGINSVTVLDVNDDSTTTYPIGTLFTFGLPAVPIVANPNTLAAAAACYSNQCLGPDDREAIEVWAMINELQADGGKDYRTNIPQLLADASSWFRLDEDTRRAITLYMNVANAVNSGANITTSINSLRKGASCLLCVGWENRRSIKLYLKALLNSGGFPE